jgi:hypothetical protein
MSAALDLEAGYERIQSRGAVSRVEHLLGAVEHPSGTTSLLLARPPTALSSLRGLGAEIWAGEDAQEYVRRLRSEWDE